MILVVIIPSGLVPVPPCKRGPTGFRADGLSVSRDFPARPETDGSSTEALRGRAAVVPLMPSLPRTRGMRGDPFQEEKAEHKKTNKLVFAHLILTQPS